MASRPQDVPSRFIADIATATDQTEIVLRGRLMDRAARWHVMCVTADFRPSCYCQPGWG
jgi:hypothetical protein